MVTKLLIVWVIGVVAFFVLWFLLAKVIRWISEQKRKNQPDEETINENPKLGNGSESENFS